MCPSRPFAIEPTAPGTPVGYPIEIEALCKCLNKNDRNSLLHRSIKGNYWTPHKRRRRCRLIKAANGAASRQIPATLHSRNPIAKIDFAIVP